MGFLEASKVDSEIDSSLPTGKMYHIACKSWFTATGSLMPLSFKFEGDDGELQIVKNLQVNYAEDKNYSGLPSKEFGCTICVGGIKLDVKLIFYCEACKWVMLV